MNRDRMTKQKFNIILLVDTSRSMQGSRIEQVNKAISDISIYLKEMQKENSNVDFYISILTFATDANWYNNQKEAMIDKFNFTEIKAFGQSNLHLAYHELNDVLNKESKGGMMPDFGGVAPIIILMTDGMPTSYDWERKLSELKKMGWFKVALKYALAVEIDTDEAMDVLTKFTGNPETVLKVYSAEALRKVIKVIAITSSKVKSQSATTALGSTANQNEIAKEEINETLAEIDDVKW